MSVIRIGVIADTHGFFDRRVSELFKNVACIVHAGDVESPHVLDELRALAPVTAVRGNVDKEELERLPFFARLEIGGKKILVTHIIGRPTKLNAATAGQIQADKPDVLIYGHTHLPTKELVDGVLMFNPGSAGPKRFDQPRCVGILEIHDGELRADWVSLE